MNKVTEVAASVAETLGAQFKVESMPEQGPPYNGVAVSFGLTKEVKQKGYSALNEALHEAGLVYSPRKKEQDSPALKQWSTLLYGSLRLEFVDMSTEHGEFMDAIY